MCHDVFRQLPILFFFKLIGSRRIQWYPLQDNEFLGDKKSSSIEVLLYFSRISIFAVIGKNAFCTKFLGEIVFSSFEFLSEFVVIFSSEEIEILCHQKKEKSE
jgi:hypothetical protein